MQLGRVLAWCVQGPGFNPQHQERQRHNYSVLFPFETVLLCCPGCPPCLRDPSVGITGMCHHCGLHRSSECWISSSEFSMHTSQSVPLRSMSLSFLHREIFDPFILVIAIFLRSNFSSPVRSYVL